MAADSIGSDSFAKDALQEFTVNFGRFRGCLSRYCVGLGSGVVCLPEVESRKSFHQERCTCMYPCVCIHVCCDDSLACFLFWWPWLLIPSVVIVFAKDALQEFTVNFGRFRGCLSRYCVGLGSGVVCLPEVESRKSFHQERCTCMYPCVW